MFWQYFLSKVIGSSAGAVTGCLSVEDVNASSELLVDSVETGVLQVESAETRTKQLFVETIEVCP